MKNILLIEDDVTLSNGIRLALQNMDYRILQCHTLREAGQFDIAGLDLIILDINLPDGNGLDFLREIRKSSDAKVIILTANDLETDIVAGFQTGADDYITKPFSLAVLQARINARLKDTVCEEHERYESENLRFDFTDMKFYAGARQVELSKTEQKLLRLLVNNKGRTLPRDLLIDRVWPDAADSVEENALSVTIKRLRDKIEETPAKPRHIKTVYGIGYVWE